MLGTREGPRLTSSPVPQRLADALRDFRVRLGLVAVLALVVRLAWVWGYGRTQEVAGDQLFYHLQGLALAQGDGFVNPYAWNDPVTPLEIPTAAHPPLYSLYLALWSLLGFETALEHRVVSVFLGVACVVVVGLVGRRLAGERAGIVAAIAAAIYANLWINDGLLAAESVYALAVAVVLLTAYRFWDEPGWSRAAVLGVAIGLATLGRAEGALLFVTIALPLAVVLREVSLRRKVELLVVIGLAGAVVLAPWVGRNLTTWDEPVLLSTGAGFVIEISNCDATYSGRYLGYWSTECDRDSTWPVQAEITPDMTPDEVAAAQQAARIESARQEPLVEQRKREEGMRYVREHLDQFPTVVAARLARMWDLWRPAQSVEFNDFFERRGRLPSLAGLLTYYVLLPLAVAGAVVLRRRRTTIVPFVGLALTVCAAAASSFGITRYRVGADVALCVLAGVAVSAAWEWWRRRGPAGATEGAAPPSDADEAAPVPAGAQG